MKCMVAYGMPFIHHGFMEVWIAACVVGHHEKSGFRICFPQHPEQQGGGFRYRAVVKCQIYGRLFTFGAKHHIASEGEKS